jgi:hypothetical protein
MVGEPRWRFDCLVGASCLLSVLASFPAAAQEPDGVIEGAFELRDGVIVDPARELVFIMSVERAVDAVALTDGRLAWSSDAAVKPLMVVDDRLLCQIERQGALMLGLALLDPESGKEQATTEMELPPSTRVYVGAGPLGYFATKAFAKSPETALVTWTFRPLVARGIDTESGIAGDEKAAALAEGLRPTSGAFSFDMADGAKRSVGLAEATGLRNNSTQVANRLAKDSAFVEAVSADGRYIIHSRHVDDDKGGYYLWRISDRQSGGPVGEFRNSIAAFSPFFVRDGLLYYETPAHAELNREGVRAEPLSIRAVELDSGKEVWSWPVRDTSVSGPQPP